MKNLMKFMKLSKLKFISLFLQTDIGSVKCRSHYARIKQWWMTICLYYAWICSCVSLLPAALRAAQTCRYLVYSEANFELFRPVGATRCTDGGKIWHGAVPNLTPIGATTRVWDPQNW